MNGYKGSGLFSNILFLLLVLLAASLVPEVTAPFWDLTPEAGLWLGMASYGVLLLFLIVQNRVLPFRYAILTLMAQLEILLFIGFFLYFLDGMRLFPEWSALQAVVVLALYAVALALVYYEGYQRAPVRGQVSRGAFVDAQLRLILPFAAPYLLLALLSDLLNHVVFFGRSGKLDCGAGCCLLCGFYGVDDGAGASPSGLGVEMPTPSL